MFRNKKRFLTIFPQGKNIHLVKDVGMIPFILQKEGFYETTIAFYEDRQHLPYLDSDLKGLKYKQIKKIFNDERLDILWFAFLNLRKFDILMFLHPFMDKAPVMVLLKWLSFGRIKLYGKMDTNLNILNNNNQNKSFRSLIGTLLYNNIDLLTVEIKLVAELLNNVSFMKPKYLPNGFNSSSTNILAKEKLIITVGRIGAMEKNHELLLNALKNVDLKDWTLKFIGPIDPNFESKIKDFYHKNPHLQKNISFVGNISDRVELSKFYARAKVFVMTSRWEGFPLVFPEALGNGCYIVSTDIPAAYDITDYERYGKIIEQDNYFQLAKVLQNIVDGDLILPGDYEIREFAEKNFSWSLIGHRLYSFIEN